MPLVEAEPAFAATMLALSLVVSSFVEIIHRTLKLRERGLKYILEQLFDQILVIYLEPLAEETIAKAGTAIDAIIAKETAGAQKDSKKGPARTPLQVAYAMVRDSFVRETSPRINHSRKTRKISS